MSYIELNHWSHEIVETFCYLGDTLGVREVAVDSVITRTRAAWNRLGELHFSYYTLMTFLMMLSVILITPCFVVAVQPCMG